MEERGRRGRGGWIVAFTVVLSTGGNAGAQDASPPALRFVEPRSGGLYASYLDIELPGGLTPRISRAYQSMSAYCGLFGCGWASDYETFLTVEGDGTVAVHEFGGGPSTIYRSPSASLRDVDQMVGQLTAAARASRPNVRADSLIAYSARLRENLVMRQLEWKRFARAGLVKAPAIPVGTRLRAVTPFGVETALRTADGYVRETSDGTQNVFDLRGRLVRASDASGHWLAIKRDAAGRLLTMSDERARTLSFRHDAKGRLLRVTDSRGKYAAYRYDARGDLVWTRDSDGVVITHAYDGLHYMTRVGYADGTKVVIEYYPISQRAKVRRVTIEDGTTAEYAYRWTPHDSLEYFVDIALLAPAKRRPATRRDTISRRHHAYIERRRANGERWMSRLVEEIDGRRETTDYDEECETPVRVVVNADTTLRGLDARCRAISLSTKRALDSLIYDDASRVMRFARHPREDALRVDTRFAYDSAGRLTSAIPISGDTVRFQYDAAGRMSGLDERSGTLRFEHDDRQRVIACAHSAYGSLSISYATDGTPTVSVAGGASNEPALSATRARLAALLRPTGVVIGC